MSFSLRGNKYLVCEALERAGFVNAFGSREMPVATPELLVNALGSNLKLTLAHQTHSDVRLYLKKEPALEGDALISSEKGHLVGIKTADCVPILIGDRATGNYAAVHAGWRGTLARIAQKTVEDLKKDFGVKPSTCIAAIGPSACVDCYEVGAEVVDGFKKEFKNGANFFTSYSAEGKAHLNSQLANADQLIRAGLDAHNIYTANRCTMHENNLFFSHRKENGPNITVGRNLSVIGRNG